MAKVVVVAAQKGGVGKTTVAVNLAHAAAERGRCVLIDTDGVQRSAMGWVQMRQRAGLSEILARGEDLTRKTDREHLLEIIASAKAGGADWIVIDAKPALDEQIGFLLGLADVVVMPVEPSRVSLSSVSQTARLASKGGKIAVWIVNRLMRKHSVDGREIMSVLGKSSFPGTLCPTPLVARADFKRSLDEGFAVSEWAPGSKADLEMRQVCQFILSQEK